MTISAQGCYKSPVLRGQHSRRLNKTPSCSNDCSQHVKLAKAALCTFTVAQQCATHCTAAQKHKHLATDRALTSSALLLPTAALQTVGLKVW